MTVRVKLVVAEPPELVAVIVCSVEAWSAVGVPEMAQLLEVRLSPAGSAGLIEQLEIAPPVEATLWVAMAVFLVAVREAGE